MKKMIAAMKPEVWWNGMGTDIENYCRTCHKCQQFKTHAPRVPSSAKPIPAKCLEDVSLDLVGPVPSAWRGMRYVLCIQDRLSRFLVFAPMPNATAEVVARTFLSAWVCQYGAPKRIVTDRGPNLMSVVFAKMCEFLGARHTPTCSYRPQGNAQNERTHKELHQYIAMYLTEANAANWDLLLGHAAWVHNSSHHAVLNCSPFELLTGLKPRSAASFLPRSDSKDEVTFEEYFNMKSEQLEQLQNEAKLAIAKAQAATMANLNKNARLPQFKVGDEVWVRKHAKLLVQKKWSEKYLGPFIVKEVISPQVIKVFLKSDPTHEDIVHTSYVRPKRDRPNMDDSDIIFPTEVNPGLDLYDGDSNSSSDELDLQPGTHPIPSDSKCDPNPENPDHSCDSPPDSKGEPLGLAGSSSGFPKRGPPQWWPDPIKLLYKNMSPKRKPSTVPATVPEKTNFSPRLTRLQRFLQNRKKAISPTLAPSTSTSMVVSPPSVPSSPSISVASTPSPATPYTRRDLYSPVSSSGSLTPTSPLSSFPWSPSPPSPDHSPAATSASDSAPSRPITRALAKKLNFSS
jgi:hypothetical protein